MSMDSAEPPVCMDSPALDGICGALQPVTIKGGQSQHYGLEDGFFFSLLNLFVKFG